MAYLEPDVVKDFLHKDLDDTGDDDQIAYAIAAAELMIVDLMGPVDPVSRVEVRRGGRAKVLLSTTPVLEVTEVLLLPATAVAAGDRETSTTGWLLDQEDAGAGILRHTSCFPYGRLQVSYSAGRDPVPGNFLEAGLELVAHLWRGSQTGQAAGGGARFGLGSDDGAVYISGVGYALPNRVCQLLGLDPKNPHSCRPMAG